MPFTNCISRRNNTLVHDAHDIDVVMPVYNLIEYSDNYSITYEILWQYCRDELTLDDNNAIPDFILANCITDSFKIKAKIRDQTGNNGTKYVEIMVPLKHLSNFFRTLAMALSNCKINIDIKWSEK